LSDYKRQKNFIKLRVQDDDNKGNVICYFKFPANFKIHIPKIIGNYNPDWGIIRYNEDDKNTMELVRETKGSLNINTLQFPNEKRKIICAKKHFSTIGINYRLVSSKIFLLCFIRNITILSDKYCKFILCLIIVTFKNQEYILNRPNRGG